MNIDHTKLFQRLREEDEELARIVKQVDMLHRIVGVWFWLFAGAVLCLVVRLFVHL